MIEAIDAKKYMSNCISRIMKSPCSIHNLYQRNQDVAEAVVIASSQGQTAAHQYLMHLCDEAEAGKYTFQETITPSDLPAVRVLRSGRVSVKW